MKIGIFLPQLEPESGGGYTLPIAILDELYNKRTDHDFFVFYYGPSRPEIGHVKFVPLSFFRTSFFHKAFFYLRKFVNKNYIAKGPLRKAVKKYDIDIVWFMTPSCEHVEIPYIFTVWDLQHRIQPFFPEVSQTGWDWDSREKHYANFLPRSTYVLTGTKMGKEEIVRFYGVADDRIRLLPLPTPDFALEGKKPGEKLPPNFLFYPAQFWPHKNHIGLIRALSLLNTKYKMDFSLVLTGSDKGNLDHVKKEVKRLKLENKVVFLGFVPLEELVYLYRNAFALTFMTLFGPDNLPPLEAFALGCPVVASNVNGASEQLGDAAIRVDGTDEVAIARAIKKLYDEPKFRSQLIKKGLDRAMAWTPKDYVEGIISIIDEFELYRRCWGSRGSKK